MYVHASTSFFEVPSGFLNLGSRGDNNRFSSKGEIEGHSDWCKSSDDVKLLFEVPNFVTTKLVLGWDDKTKH